MDRRVRNNNQENIIREPKRKTYAKKLAGLIISASVVGVGFYWFSWFNLVKPNRFENIDEVLRLARTQSPKEAKNALSEFYRDLYNDPFANSNMPNVGVSAFIGSIANEPFSASNGNNVIRTEGSVPIVILLRSLGVPGVNNSFLDPLTLDDHYGRPVQFKITQDDDLMYIELKIRGLDNPYCIVSVEGDLSALRQIMPDFNVQGNSNSNSSDKLVVVVAIEND